MTDLTYGAVVAAFRVAVTDAMQKRDVRKLSWFPSSKEVSRHD